MPTSSDLSRLVADLGADDAVRREAAVARLRIAGAAALPRLATLIASNPPPPVCAAALRALEGLTDARVEALAIAQLASADPDVAIAAASVLRWRAPAGDGIEAFRALTAAGLDERRDAGIRTAALQALADARCGTGDATLEQARRDISSAASLEDADEASQWLARDGRHAPLSLIHDVIVKARERAAGDARWLMTRGEAHAVLAERDSAVALYDLREAFAAASEPLPLPFVTAVARIGDVSCLEPLARAWAAMREESWWRDHVAAAAREIVRRRRLSGRNAAVLRVRAKWPGFL